MTHKVISLRFAIPTLLAIVLGIVLAVGVVYMGHHLRPVDQSEVNQPLADGREAAESSNADGRLSRVHLLLSTMK